jgi:hypothetical protein
MSDEDELKEAKAALRAIYAHCNDRASDAYVLLELIEECCELGLSLEEREQALKEYADE